MTIADRTPTQPRTRDGAALPAPVVTNGTAAGTTPQSAEESYRFAASLAHRSGS